ncbi:hypothetical protein TSUD_321870 [Trifolium subterraneum]|uniref:Uncharacterized protein n=1 Tax=Trifolium subterraneum TaxID=3900 RepID=A0A2Z6MUY1_TRISU|nr:hypothetical protein TSUD_321870 [Trifolium subterraneum]
MAASVDYKEKRFKQITKPAKVKSETDDEWVKLKMREWVTAVASNNQTQANLRVSEILLIMDNHKS